MDIGQGRARASRAAVGPLGCSEYPSYCLGMIFLLTRPSPLPVSGGGTGALYACESMTLYLCAVCAMCRRPPGFRRQALSA